MKEKNYIIFRVQKLHPSSRAKNSIYKSIKHLEKHAEVADISRPERSHLNRTHLNKQFKELGLKKSIKKVIDAHNKIASKKLRNDASIGAELLFSYSFADKLPSDDFLQKYEELMHRFIVKELKGFKLLRLDRHCDENSIHWHLVGFCINKKGLISTREVLGGPERMRELQSLCADSFKSLGLERGIPKRTTKRKHRTKKEYERSLALEVEEITKDIFER